MKGKYMWLTNFEQAKEESTKSHKPILLQFEMEGCGGCRKLYDHTYPDPKVQSEMNEWFVLLKLDLIKDRKIRKELAAYWTPSFYFLDHNGKPYYHFNSYLPPDDLRIIFRLGLSEILMPRGRYDEIIKIIDKDIEQLAAADSLLSRLLVQRGIAQYIKTKNNPAFRKTMKEIQQRYPKSLEARMYFWETKLFPG